MLLNNEDKLLVEGLILGDEHSFRCVYDKYHSNLYRYALKFVKSDELAKEVVHDVFLKVWEKRISLNSDLSLKYYLIKVCKNHVLNILAKSARENIFKKEILYHRDFLDNNTEDSILYADYEKFANEAIARLPPQRQAIFKMCRMEGKSYQEAADNFGISKGTVRDHMLKAGRSIRKYLSINTDISLGLFLFISILL